MTKAKTVDQGRSACLFLIDGIRIASKGLDAGSSPA
jgi:hypothetical protein